jgi:hypothetical protein
MTQSCTKQLRKYKLTFNTRQWENYYLWKYGHGYEVTSELWDSRHPARTSSRKQRGLYLLLGAVTEQRLEKTHNLKCGVERVHPWNCWSCRLLRFLGVQPIQTQCPATNTCHFWPVPWLTYAAEPFLRSCQLCSHSRTSQDFMEPEGSLPCSQQPSTGPYPELDRSSPKHPILSKI